MKIKRYTTTEFYNNPSKAISFVRDGGIVYLGYKRIKEPIAVVTSYDDYKEKIAKKELTQKKGSFFDRYGDRAINMPEYKNSTQYIRKQREQR